MEYTFDELLDITSDYLDQIDFTGYFESEGETEVQDIKEKLEADLNKGLLPQLPEALEGNIFHVFDLWDLTVYLRNRYSKSSREEIFYRYYLS